jgi:hypothetical protein
MDTPSPLHIACLCAAWCRLCDGYRDVIDRVGREGPAGALPVTWHWVDIEDEADLLGEVDIETFPTLVVFDAVHTYFAGVVEPQPETLRRLLRAWQAQAVAGQAAPAPEPALQAFVQAWRQRVAAQGAGTPG